MSGVLATRRTAAQIEAAILDARQAAVAREGDVATAGAAYTASLDQGRDAALAARARLSEAEVDRDIAHHLVERLEKDLGEARQAEAEADAEEAFHQAVAKREAFRTAIGRDLAVITDLGQGLIRLEAMALLADEVARSALLKAGGPDAANRLPPMDEFRVGYGRERREISRTVRDLWVNALGNPPSDQYQQRIKEQPDGTGRLQHDGSFSTFHHKRAFVTTEYLAAEPARDVGRLAETLAIPSLRGGDEPGWQPRVDIIYEPYPDGVRKREVPLRTHPAEVLARLDHIENQDGQEMVEAADLRVTEKKFEPDGEIYQVSPATVRSPSIRN